MPEVINQTDVSQKALSIARMLDRLPPGQYQILLRRPESPTDRWTVEVQQPVTVVQKRDVGERKSDNGHPKVIDL